MLCRACKGDLHAFNATHTANNLRVSIKFVCFNASEFAPSDGGSGRVERDWITSLEVYRDRWKKLEGPLSKDWSAIRELNHTLLGRLFADVLAMELMATDGMDDMILEV